MNDDERDRFETWISGEPFNMSIERWPDWEKYAWPGHYKRIEVQVAWAAWQEAVEGER